MGLSLNGNWTFNGSWLLNPAIQATAGSVTPVTAFTFDYINSFYPFSSVVNGALPYTYYVSSGTLPTGISIDPTTGVVYGACTTLTGYPTASVVFSVKDANNVVASTTATVSFTVTRGPITINYLVVAGGGGGGMGGGGGGGVLTGTASVTYGNTINISVGIGGTGGAAPLRQGTNGANSAISGTTISTVTAVGGGSGGGQSVTVPTAWGKPGGSGGGGGYGTAAQPLGFGFAFGSPGAQGVAGPGGYPGAPGDPSSTPTINRNWASGGGGGAGAAGTAGTSTVPANTNVTGVGGPGGAGKLWPFDGQLYGGGGGGAASSPVCGIPVFSMTQGTGGSGGGGSAGPSGTQAGSPGTSNLGGGGGGTWTGPAGGSGGPGSVRLAILTRCYPGSAPGASVSTPPAAPGYTILTYITPPASPYTYTA